MCYFAQNWKHLGNAKETNFAKKNNRYTFRKKKILFLRKLIEFLLIYNQLTNYLNRNM